MTTPDSASMRTINPSIVTGVGVGGGGLGSANRVPCWWRWVPIEVHLAFKLDDPNAAPWLEAKRVHNWASDSIIPAGAKFYIYAFHRCLSPRKGSEADGMCVLNGQEDGLFL